MVAGFQHPGRDVALAELFDNAVGGAGTRRDDGCQSAGHHVGAQHREDLLDAGLLTAGRRGGAHVKFDGVGCGQLADRPPRMPGGGGSHADLVESAEARSAELLDVDGGVTADRGHRPGRLQELLAGADQIGRAGADFFRVAHQHRGGGRQVVDQRTERLTAQHRGQRLHTVHRDTFGDLVQHFGDATGDAVIVARRVDHQFSCARTHFGIEQKFAAGDGDNHSWIELGQGALIGHREHPDFGDLIAPEFDANRMLGSRREDIEDAAAHRELAAFGDHIDAGVGQFG